MAKSGQYSRSVLGASDEVKDIYCEPCHRDGNLAIAEGYCKDCPEYLCAQCYKSHRRNRGLTNHVLLNKDSMPTAPGSIRTVLDICKEKVGVANLQSVIDIKTNKDKREPSIFGLTIMHGHYCVVSDQGNNSIKVVSTKNKQVTSEIGIIESMTIWGVTSVSDDQVVVSVTNSHCGFHMQFFSVSTSGVIRRTNLVDKVNDFYQGMVHCKGNIYGVHRTKIDILSMEGEIIRTINTNDKGADRFGSLQRIALSPDGQTIYVTDSLKHSVTSLTLDGKVKAIYTDKDLNKPWGITVDNHGYVYVRSLGTRNIQQLTADHNKLQVLIEDVDGTNITYSSTEYKLYVSVKCKINEYSLNYK